MNRRTALRAVLAGAAAPCAALPVVGCSVDAPAPAPESRPTTGDQPPGAAQPGAAGGAGAAAARVLLAYFSRAGENYSYGGRTDLQVGNTEVAARMISDLISCDVHRIEAAQPYPDSYDATVARNVAEQDDDARPALAHPAPDVSAYDVVLLGSPVWNVRPPMILSTFVEGVDLAGKRVLPFVTFAVSGLGSTQRVYAEAIPAAELGEGLAVRGEEVAEAGSEIEAWLRGSGLLTG